MGLFDKIAKIGKEVVGAVDKAANTPQNQPANTATNQTAPPVTPPPVQAVVTQNSSDEPALAQWDTLLPQYPKWCFGGHGMVLEANGDENGYPIYDFDIGLR